MTGSASQRAAAGHPAPLKLERLRDETLPKGIGLVHLWGPPGLFRLLRWRQAPPHPTPPCFSFFFFLFLKRWLPSVSMKLCFPQKAQYGQNMLSPRCAREANRMWALRSGGDRRAPAPLFCFYPTSFVLFFFFFKIEKETKAVNNLVNRSEY